MFAKPWREIAGIAQKTASGKQARRRVATGIWAVVFSLILALANPLGMAGNAQLAWAEQADLSTVASPYDQGGDSGDPQADETGSLDPPESSTMDTSEMQADDAPRSASVAIGESEQGWAHIAAGGAQPEDALQISVMGRADAIWTDLLLETWPEAAIEDPGAGEVEIRLGAGDAAEWDLPGVMADLVASAALIDQNGQTVAFAEGPALYAASPTSQSGEVFTAYNEHVVDGNCPKLRNAQTGQIAWCADSRRAAPGTSTDTGDWPEATFSQVSAWDATTVSGVNLGSVLPQLEYIMAHGDTASDEGIYIAQYAIWTFTNPDRIPYGSYAQYSDQILSLVDGANAYAQSSESHYAGSCQVYVPTTGDGYFDKWMQYLVVSSWNPLSSISVSKEKGYDAETGSWSALSKPVTWRLASVDGDDEGTTYDRTLTTADGTSLATFAETPKDTRYRLYELEAPEGFKAREAIGLYCTPGGDWLVWNDEAQDWNAATWATNQAGSRVYTGMTGSGAGSVLHVQDAPSSGAIELFKVSAAPEVTDGNACYTLEGAQYGIYADQGLTELVETVETDAAGHAASGALDEGTYWVHEIKPSKGYALDEGAYAVEVVSGATARVNEKNDGAVAEEPQGDPQAIVVRKVDSLTGANSAQGDMSLANAEITVQFYKGMHDEEEIAAGGLQPERTWVLKTDDDGVAVLTEAYKIGGDEFYKLGGRPYLPLGTTVVQETKAPVGYAMDPTIYVCHFASDESGRKWISFDMGATIPQNELKGGLAIRKADAESGDAVPKGAAVLDGTTFAIYNASKQAVTVDGVVFEPQTPEAISAGTAQAIMTVTAHGGIATTDSDGDGHDDSFPFGTYYIHEIMPGIGYLIDDTLYTACVHEDGGIAQCEVVAKNQVIRGDLAFDKVHENSRDGMAGVAFLMESVTTHERHVVVTDSSGRVNTSSAAHAHSVNTNANDAAYDPVRGSIDESKLDPAAGVWFYGTLDATGAVDDSMGALPYDTYTLTELETSASEGTWLTSFTATVDKNGAIVDMGTVEDVWIPALATELLARDGSHDAYALGDERLTDTASYGHFRPGTYTAVLELCDEDGNVLQDNSGNMLRTSSELELSGSGSYSVGIDCDLSGLAGQRIVARQRVYDADGNPYATHDDLADTSQSVRVNDAPNVKTTLTASDTGLHMANAADKLVLKDKVDYSGLKPGKTYVLTGTVVDKESGSQILGDDGSVVSSSVEFTPESASGSQTVEFAFNASAFAGKTLVAFETLACDGRTLAIHADMDDSCQTVTIPKVSTEFATADGSRTVMGDSPIDLIDTVSYENLLDGMSYRLVGTLHDGKTGEACRDTAGKDVEASIEFTADAPSGTAQVTFKGVSGIRTGQAVAFEELYVRVTDGESGEAWRLVGLHCDLADAKQTVSFNTPSLRTTLTEKETGLHETASSEKVTLVDLVDYEGLEAGKTYRIEGRLVDKQTGKALRDAKGRALTVAGDFKAPSAKGRVSVTFPFDASQFAGREIVAFESVTFDGREIAVHANVADASQTVSFVDIRTTASDPIDGDQEANALPGMQLLDKVELRGLIAGQPYTIVTELADADTHETVIASSTRFVPTKSATTLNVTATFDGTGLAGKRLVFLEKLQRDGKTVVEHRDWDDARQTVALVTPPTAPSTPDAPSGDLPQTGQGLMWAALIGAGTICLAAGLVLVIRRYRNSGEVPVIVRADVAMPLGGYGDVVASSSTATNAPLAIPRIRPRNTGAAGMENDHDR